MKNIYLISILFLIPFAVAETSSSSINWASHRYVDENFCKQNGDCNISNANILNQTVTNTNYTGNIDVYGNATFYGNLNFIYAYGTYLDVSIVNTSSLNVDDIYIFLSPDNKLGTFKVMNVSGGALGSINIDIKIQ